jgi:hypothetical protein
MESACATRGLAVGAETWAETPKNETVESDVVAASPEQSHPSHHVVALRARVLKMRRELDVWERALENAVSAQRAEMCKKHDWEMRYDSAPRDNNDHPPLVCRRCGLVDVR